MTAAADVGTATVVRLGRIMDGVVVAVVVVRTCIAAARGSATPVAEGSIVSLWMLLMLLIGF